MLRSRREVIGALTASGAILAAVGDARGNPETLNLAEVKKERDAVENAKAGTLKLIAISFSVPALAFSTASLSFLTSARFRVSGLPRASPTAARIAPDAVNAPMTSRLLLSMAFLPSPMRRTIC